MSLFLALKMQEQKVNKTYPYEQKKKQRIVTNKEKGKIKSDNFTRSIREKLNITSAIIKKKKFYSTKKYLTFWVHQYYFRRLYLWRSLASTTLFIPDIRISSLRLRRFTLLKQRNSKLF